MKQLLILSVLFFSQGLAAPKPQPIPSDADVAWVDQRLGEARDILLPPAVEFPSVVYRSSRDAFVGAPDSYFAIKFGTSAADFLEGAEARLLTVGGGSLRTQLIAQRAADREAPLSALLLRVNIRRHTFTATNCRGLKKLLDDFSRMVLPIVPPMLLLPPALHATSHRVMINVPGQSLDAGFNNEESALIRWALATLGTLQTCASPIR